MESRINHIFLKSILLNGTTAIPFTEEEKGYLVNAIAKRVQQIDHLKNSIGIHGGVSANCKNR